MAENESNTKPDEVEAAQEEVEREAEEAQPTAARTWTVGPEDDRRSYVQKPLGFIKKFRFFALLGGTIRSAIATSGEGAVGDLLGGAETLRERASQISSTDVRDAEQFLNIASSLLVYVPDFLESAYCEWLDVPFEDRADVVEYLRRDPAEGGLSDEDGVGIINAFVDQNWEHLRDFFGVHLKSVVDNVQSRTSSEEEVTATG